MNKYLILALSLSVIPAFAQDVDKPKPDKAAHKAKMLEKYDKDGDGKLSDSEKEAMKADKGKKGMKGKKGARKAVREASAES